MDGKLWQQVHRVHGALGSIRATARQLGIHRRTVREALRSPHPPKRSPAPRTRLIDPYRGWILGKLEQYPLLTATRLHRMLCENGYTGGYGTVKDCVRELRPRAKPAHFTLSFAPGEAAQADWGCWEAVEVPGGRRRLSFFVMVLCHSRLLYAEFFYGQGTEHWLAAHRNALEFFGGVPACVIVDNCKTAGTTPATGDTPAVFNDTYLDLAQHYGFRPVACRPHRPNEKGRVESAVGYIRSSFLAGRESSPIEALNPALFHWRDTVANVRSHNTTGRRPIDLFTEAEKDALQPLPAGPHPCTVDRTVACTSRFRFTVDTNRYSVPSQYAGRKLSVRIGTDRVTVHDPDSPEAPVADHPRSFGRNRNILNPEHERQLIVETRHSRDRRLLATFLALGPHAEPYLTGLREKRPDWKSHLRRINALAEIHGRDETARALADACEQHAFSSEYVLNILEARSRNTPRTGALHLTRSSDLLEVELPDPDLDLY
jgi:transposase